MEWFIALLVIALSFLLFLCICSIVDNGGAIEDMLLIFACCTTSFFIGILLSREKMEEVKEKQQEVENNQGIIMEHNIVPDTIIYIRKK